MSVERIPLGRKRQVSRSRTSGVARLPKEWLDEYGFLDDVDDIGDLQVKWYLNDRGDLETVLLDENGNEIKGQVADLFAEPAAD